MESWKTGKSGRSSSITACMLLSAVSAPIMHVLAAMVAPWPRAGVLPLAGPRCWWLVVSQLRTPATGAHIASGLRLLAPSLLSAAAPGPWDGKNGCPAVQHQQPPPPRHHAAHIVDTGIVLTSPAQPNPAQPSPAQTGRCRLGLDNGVGAAARQAVGHRRSYKLNLVNCAWL